MQVLLFENQCKWAQGPEFTFPLLATEGRLQAQSDLGAFHIIRCGARHADFRR